ncbi:MAG: GNAT family N-acetyltransferase [Clostridia bacterium]|nr:GNAT family N-acetyltransferase [Clostridia bacterium]
MKINFISKLFSHMPTLETDRLIFRALKRTDLYDVHEYSSNPKTTQYLLWEPHPSLEYTREFIEIVLSKYKSGEYNDWAIVHKKDDKMIGTCGFTRIDEENNVVEIGYVLNPQYWGRGLATEAVGKIIEFAFEELQVNRIEAKFIFGNEASLAVMKKVGMKFEGYQREAMLVKGKYKTIGTASILNSEYFLN